MKISVITYDVTSRAEGLPGGWPVKVYADPTKADYDLRRANELFWGLVALFDDPGAYAGKVAKDPRMAELQGMFPQQRIYTPTRFCRDEGSPFAIEQIDYVA